jgi:hypothetical protein
VISRYRSQFVSFDAIPRKRAWGAVKSITAPHAVGNKMNPFTMFSLLIAGHALVDFPLQGDATAVNKNRHAKTELQKHVPFYYWLCSHAIIHGAAVGLITGSIGLGIAEAVAHWLIDFGKCEKWFNIHVDQFLHILCKVIWLFIAFSS